jgi:hypothetical protein
VDEGPEAATWGREATRWRREGPPGSCNIDPGTVSERPKDHVSKTCVGATPPWVQIPPVPPQKTPVHAGVFFFLGAPVVRLWCRFRSGRHVLRCRLLRCAQLKCVWNICRDHVPALIDWAAQSKASHRHVRGAPDRVNHCFALRTISTSAQMCGSKEIPEPQARQRSAAAALGGPH